MGAHDAAVGVAVGWGRGVLVGDNGVCVGVTVGGGVNVKVGWSVFVAEGTCVGVSVGRGVGDNVGVGVGRKDFSEIKGKNNSEKLLFGGAGLVGVTVLVDVREGVAVGGNVIDAVSVGISVCVLVEVRVGTVPGRVGIVDGSLGELSAHRGEDKLKRVNAATRQMLAKRNAQRFASLVFMYSPQMCKHRGSPN